MNTSESCRTSTPWGRAQWVTRCGRGINLYSTAGHGGFKVSKGLNATMPDCLRIDDGWYEEDCDYARVVLAFPDRFNEGLVAAARDSLKRWNPKAYAEFTKGEAR